MKQASNRIIVTVALMTALCSCAATGDRPDSAMMQRQSKCDFDETYSCIERIGHPTRCFCADKDTLRELLEPTIE